MYLSKIELDLTKSGVNGDLGDCHRLHQKVMLGFPDQFHPSDIQKNECRKDWQILYRLEGSNLLVQSSIKPNWGRLPKGYSFDPAMGTKELDFQMIEAGELLRFRLVANPVKQLTCARQDDAGQPILKTDGSGKPQKKTLRRLITNEREQIFWLAQYLKGAQLEECYVSAPGKYNLKDKKSIIYTVQFDGILEIISPPDFLKILSEGIGRGKSYGCGLLSVARL
jgi:CRISPR system Cascade subunit CasE